MNSVKEILSLDPKIDEALAILTREEREFIIDKVHEGIAFDLAFELTQMYEAEIEKPDRDLVKVGRMADVARELKQISEELTQRAPSSRILRMMESQQFPEKEINDISASLGLNEGQRNCLKAAVREALSDSAAAGTLLDAVEVSLPHGMLKMAFRRTETDKPASIR